MARAIMAGMAMSQNDKVSNMALLVCLVRLACAFASTAFANMARVLALLAALRVSCARMARFKSGLFGVFMVVFPLKL